MAESALHCSNCGRELTNGSRFCTECGTRAGDRAAAGQSAEAVSASEQHGQRWRMLHSIWMLWLLTLGFFSFIGVLYAGIRARRRRWIIAGALYAIPPVIFFAASKGSTLENVAGIGCLIVGVASAVQSFRFRREYLDVIAGGASTTPRPPRKGSRKWERRAAKARMADPLDAAAATLKNTISAYRDRVNAAERTLRDTAKTTDQATKDADKEAVKQAAERQLQGGRMFPVTLFEESVKMRGTTRRLSEKTDATVDTAGNLMTTRRFTLTRFALLGVFSVFAPKKVHDDKRELYLLVEDPDWAEVVKLKPDQGQQARTMAQQIRLAARNLETAKTQRAARTKASEERASQVRAEGAAAVASARQSAQAACLQAGDLQAARDVVAAMRPQPDASRTAKRAANLLAEADALLANAAAKAAAYDRQPAAPPPEPPPSNPSDDPTAAPSGGDPFKPPTPEAADFADAEDVPEPAPVSAVTVDSPPADEAVESSARREPADAPAQDPLSTIAGLAELHREGILTDEEFEAKKTELLKRL